MKWESHRVRSIRRSATLDSSERGLSTSKRTILDLVSGAPELDTPAEIKAAARAALDEDYRYMKYTSSAGLLELRDAIAAKLKQENAITATVDDIIVTVGVKEGIALATQACLQPGDEVLLFTPAWVSYDALIRLAGALPISLPLSTGPAFLPGMAEIENRITPRTRAILLNTPHNPTGRLLSAGDLDVIASLAQRHDLLVLVDETLEYLNYTELPHLSIAALQGMAKRTVTFNGFSKAFCMTGWRVGYAAGPRSIITNMLTIHQHLVTCANAVAQRGAVVALTGSQEGRHSIRAALEKRRNVMVEGLNGISGMRCITPQAGLFCFPDISSIGLSDKSFSEFCLQESEVALLPGSVFGAGGEGHVRVAFARRSINDLIEAVSRIKRALAEERHSKYLVAGDHRS